MRTRIPIGIAAVCMMSAPAIAEPVSFADLQGTTLEANWVEDMTFRPQGVPKARNARSPRQVTLTFGPGGAITHRLIRAAGDKSRTENRQMQIDKAQPSGIGFSRWAFENGSLVYIETLFSGARRLVVSLDRKDGKLTCTVAAQVAREGNKPVLTIGLDNTTRLELLDVKAIGGDCTIQTP